jgi:glycosyltransferase involved in cell wall biosynthesis
LRNKNLKPSLNIGYDAKRLFHNFTGLGNYSRTLVKSLQGHFPENEYHLFTPSFISNEETQYFLDENKFTIHQYTGPFPAWWRSMGILKDIAKADLDIYHGLSNELPFGIGRTKTRAIVTIHDVIFKKRPQDYPWFDRQLYHIKTKRALKEANQVVAISDYTGKEISRFYDITEDNITVIPPILDTRYRKEISDSKIQQFKEKHHLSSSFILYVGSIIARKNVLSLLKALRLMNEEERPTLVILGKGKQYLSVIKQFIQNNKLNDSIQFLDSLTADELPLLYKSAKILVYPSIEEGFGLPVLEALATGIPVITHNASSLQEAAGLEEFRVDCHSPQAIKERINQMLGNANYVRDLSNKLNNHLDQYQSDKISALFNQLYRQQTSF